MSTRTSDAAPFIPKRSAVYSLRTEELVGVQFRFWTRRASEGLTSRIAIGFMGSVSYGLLPRMLCEFRAACPSIHIDLREQTTVEQTESVHTSKIRIGIAWRAFDAFRSRSALMQKRAELSLRALFMLRKAY